MILFEFLDKNSIDNIIGTLLLKPDIVFFVGCRNDPPQKMLDDYKTIIKKRGLNCDLQYLRIADDSPESVADKILSIVEHDDCVFNINGGNEIYLVGIGIVYARCSNKVKIHRYDAYNNNIINLSVEEGIRIYGGKVPSTSRWIYTAEFCEDIKKMWKISSLNTTVWNAQMTTLSFLQNVFVSDNILKVSFNKKEAKKRAISYGVKYVYYDMVFAAMEKNGLITKFFSSEDWISFEYKNLEIKEIIGKTGTILELYVDIAAREVLNKYGNRMFDDVRTGLEIEWDRHLEKDEIIATKNEIDVVLMKNTIPFFISCKSGQVNVDELYKLSIVAENFGGKRARKILIAPNLERIKGGEYISRRAKDMGIMLLTDTETISFEDFKKQLFEIGDKI